MEYAKRPSGIRSTAGYSTLALLVGLVVLTETAHSQSVLMRRSNTIGNWRLYVNNNGVLFNQSDGAHLFHDGVGGLWYEPSGRLDTMIFGAGLWLGGFRRRADTLAPHVEYSYEPNHGGSGFVPGSIIYGGNSVDTSDVGRAKYNVYRSTGLTGDPWPIRFSGGKARYIDDPLARSAAGPAATIGDEDVFVVNKDTDPSWARDSIGDPFRAEIRTQVATWRSGLLKDVALVHNEIIYSGLDTVYEPVVATVVDGDIFYEEDDRLKRVFRNEGGAAAVFFTDQSTTEPMMGVTAFGQYGPHRTTVGLTVVRYWDILNDPTTDSARYDFLTDPRHDLELSGRGDARLLMSSKSDEPWVPGDTIDFDFVIFAKEASGDPEMSAQDSSVMLGIAEQLTTHYFSNTLGELYVRSDAPAPAMYRSGQLLVVEDPNAELFDVLGRRIGSRELTYQHATFDLGALPAGAYFIRSGTGTFAIVR